jgi:anti-sigma regulatory factor (Ser/Thr protein kinase)
VNEAFTNGVEHTASGRGGRVTVAFVAAEGGIVAEVTDDGADGARPSSTTIFWRKAGGEC